MTYIAKTENNQAVIFFDPEGARDSGLEYFATELPIPEGSGILMTDGVSKVWWEEIPPVDLAPVKAAKINFLNSACEDAIHAGADIELSDGTTEHFEFKDRDQANIKQIFDAVKDGATAYPYQSENGKCKIYTAADIVKIYTTMTTLITSTLTYYHQLKDYVNSLKTVTEIEAVAWGQELTGEYLEHYNVMMAEAAKQMQNVIAKVGGAM